MANSILPLNKLPWFVLEKIFSFLPVYERIRLRCVCKLWKEQIERVGKHLCIYHSPYPVNRFWFYPNRMQVSDLDKIKVRFGRSPTKSDHSHPDTEIGFPKFPKSIQKLAIYSTQSDHCHLTLTKSFKRLLNSLHQLNELSLDRVVLSSTFTKIKLQNLKVLTLNKIRIEDDSLLVLSLETPQLGSIFFHPLHEQSEFFIHLAFPEVVKSVRCFRFDETFKMCSNLEHLSFEKIWRPFDLLVRHPNLKLIEALPSNDADELCIEMLRSQMQLVRRRSLELVVSGSLDGSVFRFPRSENPLVEGFLPAIQD